MAFDELAVRSGFDELALVKHENPVDRSERGQPMRDHKNGPSQNNMPGEMS